MATAHRAPPDGFQSNYNTKLWNAAHLFRWSEVYDCWLDCEYRFTVKPGETYGEAYFHEMGEPIPYEHEVFIPSWADV